MKKRRNARQWCLEMYRQMRDCYVGNKDELKTYSNYQDDFAQDRIAEFLSKGKTLTNLENGVVLKKHKNEAFYIKF